MSQDRRDHDNDERKPGDRLMTLEDVKELKRQLLEPVQEKIKGAASADSAEAVRRMCEWLLVTPHGKRESFAWRFA